MEATNKTKSTKPTSGRSSELLDLRTLKKSIDGKANTSHTHNYAGSSSAGGAANSANTLATARTINGTSFNGSSNITTANWGTARTITIGSTGKSVNGSANISWSLGEIGAAAVSHGNHVPTTQTADARKFLRNDNTWQTLPSASTSATGIVQLSSATNSTSTTLAATASAVKSAYDLAASKASTSVATTSANGLMSSTDKSLLNSLDKRVSKKVVYISSLCTISNGTTIQGQDSIIKQALNNNKIVDFEGYEVNLSSEVLFEDCLIRNMRLVRKSGYTGYLRVTNHAKFIDCTFEGNRGQVVYVNNSYSVNFLRCHFLDATVVFNPGSEHYQAFFEQCSFTDSHGSHINNNVYDVSNTFVLYEPTSTSTYFQKFGFSNCKVDTGRAILVLKQIHNLTVNNNLITGNGCSRGSNPLDMFYLFSIKNGIIASNIIRQYNSGGSILSVFNSFNVTLANNTTYTNDTLHCIYVSNTKQLSITGNNLTESDYGITVNSSSDMVTINSNTVSRMNERGIVCKDSWHITIENNNISHCNRSNKEWNSSILVMGNNGVTVSGNYVHRDAAPSGKPTFTISNNSNILITGNCYAGTPDIAGNTNQVLTNNLQLVI